MKIGFRLVMPFLLLLAMCSEKVPADRVAGWMPEKPVAGRALRIQYHPESPAAVLKDPATLRIEILALGDAQNHASENRPMQKNGTSWRADYQVPEAARLLLIRFLAGDRVDDRGGESWHALVYGRDERPLPGAHLQKSLLLQTGGRDGFAFPRDPGQAEIELEVELALYPASLAAKAALWDFLLVHHPGDAASERVRNELRQAYEQAGGDEEILAALLPFFFRTGQAYIARQIIEESLHLLPRGPVAKAARRLEIEREPDAARKTALQRAFERDFGRSEALPR